MATTQEPDWETPAQQPPKVSIFRKSNPFTRSKSGNRLIGIFGGSGKQSPLASIAKEAGGENAHETATTSELVSSRPQRTYFGLSRKRMILIIITTICLVALIIGLAVGLTNKKSSKAQNLPLPSNTATFSGDLTYYSPGPGYGACGFENTSTDSICAVSHIIWDAASTSSNPNNNPLCGKKIRITRFDATKGGNRSVDVEVVDRCVGCKATDLDLSLKMFTTLADEALGRTTGSWAWLN